MWPEIKRGFYRLIGVKRAERCFEQAERRYEELSEQVGDVKKRSDALVLLVRGMRNKEVWDDE